MKLNNKSGQSLFELMMAVGITALTLVAIINLVGSSVSNTSFARDRTQAARYTNEALEWLRNQRDLSWSTVTANASVTGTTYCINTLDFNTAGSCLTDTFITGSKFSRELVLIYDDTVDPSSMEARVITNWSDSGGSHESRASTVLTNWRTR